MPLGRPVVFLSRLVELRARKMPGLKDLLTEAMLKPVGDIGQATFGRDTAG